VGAGNLREWDGIHRLSTGPDQPFPFAGRHPHLRIDNDDLAPAAAAEQVVHRLGLPRA
jgi:hypothetical protein